MTVLHLVTRIHAPVQACFDLARSVDAHLASTTQTGERAVAGVTSGLLVLGDEVTWEARHFGIRQRLRVRITEMDAPRRFVDEMISGAFRRMRHVHAFASVDGGTEMTDDFEYDAPLGVLGKLADAIALKRHMLAFLSQRNVMLRTMAEASG